MSKDRGEEGGDRERDVGEEGGDRERDVGEREKHGEM